MLRIITSPLTVLLLLTSQGATGQGRPATQWSGTATVLVPRGDLRPIDVARPTQVVELRTIPEAMVRLDTRGDWTVSRQPKSRPGSIGPGPGATIYVARNKVASPGRLCGHNFTDVVDLAQIRRNGFTLAEARYERLPVKPNFVGGPIRSGVSGEDASGRPLPADTPLARYDRIRVIGYVFHWKIMDGYAMPCESGYRLHLSVRGPAGINPLTGRPIRPQVVN